MHQKFSELKKINYKKGIDTMSTAKFQKLEDFKKIEKYISKWCDSATMLYTIFLFVKQDDRIIKIKYDECQPDRMVKNSKF